LVHLAKPLKTQKSHASVPLKLKWTKPCSE
jgi:hypothetical protein